MEMVKSRLAGPKSVSFGMEEIAEGLKVNTMLPAFGFSVLFRLLGHVIGL